MLYSGEARGGGGGGGRRGYPLQLHPLLLPPRRQAGADTLVQGQGKASHIQVRLYFTGIGTFPYRPKYGPKFWVGKSLQYLLLNQQGTTNQSGRPIMLACPLASFAGQQTNNLFLWFLLLCWQHL